MKEPIHIDEAERKILATFYGYTNIRKRKGTLIGKLGNNYKEIPKYHTDLNAVRTIEQHLSRAERKCYCHVLIYNAINIKYKLYSSGYLNRFEINKKQILLFAEPYEKVAALVTVITKK